jgi:hypothetical protein
MSEQLVNVEESATHSLLILYGKWWCPQRESNPHSFEIDFESIASTSSAMRALVLLEQILPIVQRV